VSQPDVEGAIAYAIGRLRNELPEHLTYHNLWHTVSDVMPAVERLARLEQVDEEGMMLLRVAAAFHDVGYVTRHNEHEITGARIAAQVLPEYGFSDKQIDAILGMIIATRLPQMPRNPLEEIMVDADLDTLGRDDFAKRSEDLRQELVALGQSISNCQWQKQQLKFVKAHEFFTQAARELRGETKRKHLAMLEQRVRQAS
jgi:uncharacterized protein